LARNRDGQLSKETKWATGGKATNEVLNIGDNEARRCGFEYAMEGQWNAGTLGPKCELQDGWQRCDSDTRIGKEAEELQAVTLLFPGTRISVSMPKIIASIPKLSKVPALARKQHEQ